QLALVPILRRALVVHPAQGTGHEHCGSRAATFGGESGEAVDVFALRTVRLTAADTVTELARQEPHRHSCRRDRAVRLSGDALDFQRAIGSLQTRLAVPVVLDPCLGVILDAALESE